MGTWPAGGGEQQLSVDDANDRVWGLPGDFAYVGIGGAPARTTTRIELQDGTPIGTLVPGRGVWRLTAPREAYSGTIYVSYTVTSRGRSSFGFGSRSRTRLELGKLATKKLRPQPGPERSIDTIDVSAIVDVSGSMATNDPDYKRRDAVDLLFRSSRTGDRIGVTTFNHFAQTALSPTEIRTHSQARTLSKRVTPKIVNGGGTDYDGAFDRSFVSLYEDAKARQTLAGRRKLAIFLTDGGHLHRGSSAWPQYRNTHLRFTHSPGEHSWPVCVIQLGASFTSRDVNRLKRIAASTGGLYFHANSSSSLVDISVRAAASRPVRRRPARGAGRA